MSTARLRLAVAGETLFPPRAPFSWRSWGTSRFLRGGTHGSPTSPLLGRRAFGFPTPLHAHRATKVPYERARRQACSRRRSRASRLGGGGGAARRRCRGRRLRRRPRSWTWEGSARAVSKSTSEAEEETLTQGIDLVVKSPGVRADVPLIAAARARGVPVWDELELGARLLSNPIVAVTGTNGKTTTTRAPRRDVPGRRAARRGRRQHRSCAHLARRLRSRPDAWVVCEVGVFQLDDMQVFHPRIGVLVNLEPDHLDRYGDVRALRGDEAPDVRAPDRGRHRSRARADSATCPARRTRRRVRRRRPAPGRAVDPGRSQSRERGGRDRGGARGRRVRRRDRASASETSTASSTASRTSRARRRALRQRLQGDERGRGAARDRGASSRDAARHPRRPRQARELRATLAAAFREGDRAYLIGEAAEEIAAALVAAGVRTVRAGDLETAVARATAAAASPGDVVLLSPACASFDQFRDFEARGDAFRELVEALR